LLDGLPQKEGIAAESLPCYNRVAYGQLAAAYQVMSGEADVCLVTRSAA
jgi:putative molybdopterin biosynthesis protein